MTEDSWLAVLVFFVILRHRNPRFCNMKGLKRLFAMLIVCVVACCAAPHARSFSFDLDSIAAMGKFPRFVVNTYRWGNEFFNGYDTTYV